MAAKVTKRKAKLAKSRITQQSVGWPWKLVKDLAPPPGAAMLAERLSVLEEFRGLLREGLSGLRDDVNRQISAAAGHADVQALREEIQNLPPPLTTLDIVKMLNRRDEILKENATAVSKLADELAAITITVEELAAQTRLNTEAVLGMAQNPLGQLRRLANNGNVAAMIYLDKRDRGQH
jgi:hypothetical protein